MRGTWIIGHGIVHKKVVTFKGGLTSPDQMFLNSI